MVEVIEDRDQEIAPTTLGVNRDQEIAPTTRMQERSPTAMVVIIKDHDQEIAELH